MDHLHKLQVLDNEAKKFWLVILTSLSALIIITFWVFYLNATIVAVNDPPKLGVWQVFKAGLGVIGEKVEFGLANSYVYFSQGKRIDIK